uniref:Uncharacterized protein n=1 Tax=Anguilla anguilla TaxID=7936 RepID=A0A0E9UXV0_ANGAN
MVRKSTIK